ncbi:uncharacterized protein LOC133222224 [Neopsephotus bourkii]|uniref:uncharacterized protein LOC133222224 n=1 Tax=Neopsephotus bourkii TaxID=309878 RepID=UPI002AA5DBB6|nr:uncharacterized protein LOC133222224 [Neopsephotus bourkii]
MGKPPSPFHCLSETPASPRADGQVPFRQLPPGADTPLGEALTPHGLIPGHPPGQQPSASAAPGSSAGRRHRPSRQPRAGAPRHRNAPSWREEARVRCKPAPAVPDSDAPAPGLLEGRHSPIVLRPPPPLASKSTSDPTEALTFPVWLPGRQDGRSAPTSPHRQAVLPPPLLQASSSSSVPAARRPGGVSRRVPAGAAPAAPLSVGRAADGGRRRVAGRVALFLGCAAEVAAFSSPLSARSLLRAVLRCSPDLSVRPARLPPTRSQAASREAHRPRRRPEGLGGDGGFRPSLPASPRGLMHALRGERRPCPGLASGEQPREGHWQRGAEHGEAPSGTAAVVVTAAGPASAAAGCRAPPGLSPCQCPAAASESECQAAPFPFLPSFLPCLPPLPRCQPSPAGSLRRPVPGCPLRVSVPRLPAAGAVPGEPRPGWPPLPFRGCRERAARRRSAPGSAAAAVTVCLCHVCAWAGGGAGPRRSQPADTPPSDRLRAPNQRLPPARPARPRSAEPRVATPGPGTASASRGRGL